MSGIINTISPSFRGLSLSAWIEVESKVSCMTYDSQPIRDVLNDLLNPLYPSEDDPSSISLENLRRTVYSLLAESPSSRPTRDDKQHFLVLKILCQLLFWIEHDIFAKTTFRTCFCECVGSNIKYSVPWWWYSCHTVSTLYFAFHR